MNNAQDHRLLIVGNPSPSHIGAHFLRAARSLNISAQLCDSNAAFDGMWLTSKLNWWLRDHRPVRLREFSQAVVTACRHCRPTFLLTTGLAPVHTSALKDIGRLGIVRLNYLTDDPWNPTQRAGWFLQSLSCYDAVFSPRHSNIYDLLGAGCKYVEYMPFAYCPEMHYPEPPISPDEHEQFSSDIVFAGGADRDRIPYITALLNAEFKVALYGGYWNRFRETRLHTSGHASTATLRKAIRGAKVALCLVRRANRDGHVMRSFEVPAIGACMLVEDTSEHREIFGAEGEAVVYFQTIDEMISKLRWLLAHDDERQRLSAAAHARIIGGHNTYCDRLITMLEHCCSGVPMSSQNGETTQ